MTGNKYNRYYTPLVGQLLVLPFPEEKYTTLDLDIPLIGAEGNIIDLRGGVLKGTERSPEILLKGVVVEKGKDNPNFISMVKRRDVILFSKGSGLPICIPTQVGCDAPVDREFLILNEERDVIAIV